MKRGLGIIVVALLIMIILCSRSNITNGAKKEQSMQDINNKDNVYDESENSKKCGYVDEDMNNQSDGESEKNDYETITEEFVEKSNLEGDWPTSKLVEELPKPRDGLVVTYREKEENVCIIYVRTTKDCCIDYAKRMIKTSYNYDEQTYNDFIENNHNEVQFGKNDGSLVKLSFVGNMLTITVFKGK